jgi:hypothetical protein
LGDHAEGEYDGTCIITEEMTDHSATKSYLEKNNLHCFTLFPNFEKPIKAVIHSPPPPPYFPLDDIANSLEDLDLSTINVSR